MKPYLRVPLAMSLCALTLFFAAPARGDDPSGHEIRVRTVPVPGRDQPRLIADAIVEAPPARLWAILRDCNRYRTNLPSISHSRELSRSGDLAAGTAQIRCEITVDLPWPLDDLTSISVARHRSLPGGGFERSWRLESGNYEYNEGSWRIEAREGGQKSYLRYTLLVQAATALPDWLKRSAQRRSIPKLFRHLRRLVGAPGGEE